MREFDPTRDCVSLENRWGRLQAAINKFHGYYELHERSPKSGQTLEDVKRDAMRSYQETNKNKPFKHEDCWEICRKNVKWCTKLLTKQDVNKKQKPIVDSSNENSPTSKQAQFDPSFIAGSSYATENICNEAENTNDEGIARPANGRKAVKDQRKKMAAEKSVADALGNLQAFLERQADLNRAELELKKEKDKKDFELRREIFTSEIESKKEANEVKKGALKRKEQERILDKELTRLAPNVRKKYELMQAQILIFKYIDYRITKMLKAFNCRALTNLNIFIKLICSTTICKHPQSCDHFL
ncbi:hypothetical protein OROMI_013192 [Orobanche minor]